MVSLVAATRTGEWVQVTVNRPGKVVEETSVLTIPNSGEFVNQGFLGPDRGSISPFAHVCPHSVYSRNLVSSVDSKHYNVLVFFLLFTLTV